MPSSKTNELIASFTNLLRDNEVMHKDEARKWVLDNASPELGMDDRKANMILSFGYNKAKKQNIWHKEGDYLVWGPRGESNGNGADITRAIPPLQASVVPVSAYAQENGHGSPPNSALPASTGLVNNVDISVFDDPQEQFAITGKMVGIQRVAAEKAAYYVAHVADLFDPTAVWKALSECAYLIPSARTLWFNTWVKHIEKTVPDNILDDVTRNMPGPGEIGPTGRTVNKGAKLWTVLNGQPVPTTPDDPTGVSFREAIQWADVDTQRRERRQPAPIPQSGEPGLSGVLSTMISEQGATERKRMEVSQVTQPKDTGPSSLDTMLKFQQSMLESQTNTTNARLDSNTQLFTARMEAMQQRSDALIEKVMENSRALAEKQEAENRHQREMAQQQHEYAMEKLTTLYERSQQTGPTNPFAMLDEWFPGLGKTMIDKMINGDKTDLETYKARDEIERKRQLVDLGAQYLPQVIQLGRDMVEATNRVAAASQQQAPQQRQTSPQPSPVLPPSKYNKSCTKCGILLTVDIDSEAFICPSCHTPQTPSGDIIIPEALPAHDEQTEQGEVLVPAAHEDMSNRG